MSEEDALLERRHTAYNLLVAEGKILGDVEVWCDRCGAKVAGWRGEYITSGFYYLMPGEERDYLWASCFVADEVIICDTCMWSDAQYIHTYGKRL